ncbi:recombinase family protein [Phenylobacterium aquaticum]|uniref:recombinase family protein n=1 Tax=Phenylobacterium aquaticum TaxID=1763816 RepID=UPI001F5C1B88|nr:recombinase family protein [Phenylobacterium aquaticum]
MLSGGMVGTTSRPRAPKIRAAQYLRMSTEHQRYSPEHQAAAIAAYAAGRGYEVVRTYLDAGLSGVTLKQRKALRQLLADVVGGEADFQAVLVYDVSRWGRFQNPDQSAHYEFLCAEAGVQVEYCAEPFDNDGSMSSTILKGLKRVMAAEYSRELSSKVAAAQTRLARKGFWQGSSPGYGLRRQIIDEHGRPGAVLEAGQYKAAHNHRTILIPGPDHETEVVRRIYRLYVVTGMTKCAIARLLNSQGVPAEAGATWTTNRVIQILRNPKYIGDLVYHRTKVVLGGKPARIPPNEWVKAPGAFEAIVDRRMFAEAQRLTHSRSAKRSDAEMLAAMVEVLREHGRLNEQILLRSPGAPCPSAIRKRFGGLKQAYDLIGYARDRTVRAPYVVLTDDELLAKLWALLLRHGRLSVALIKSDRSMPKADIYCRRFGSITAAYARIGYVQLSRAELASPVGAARLRAMVARAGSTAKTSTQG